METIRLNFDAEVLGPGKTITVEMPYSDGVVATSRFCPVHLLSGDVELLAAINGEPLDDFVADCKLQLRFAKEAIKDSNLHEAFIAGLVASVMEHKVRKESLSYKEYLLHLDVFSWLVYAAGINEEQVSNMYPKVLNSIMKTINDVR